MIRKNTWLWASIAVALSTWVTSGPAARAQTRISIGYVASASWLGAYVAEDQGFFAKHGIDATLTLIAVSPSVPPALVAGSLQVGGVATPDVLHAVEGGIDLVIISGASKIIGRETAGPPIAGVVGQNGIGIRYAQDFVGKKVGVPGFGTAMDIGFREWLLQNRVDLRSVDFVEVPFAQGADALRAKLVDAVVSNSPFVGRIIDSNVGYLVADFTRDLPPAVATAYVATHDWVNQNPEAARAVQAALQEATAFAEQNPDEARASIGKWTKLPPTAQAAVVMPLLKANIAPDDLSFWSDAMRDQGLLQTSPDLNKLIMR